MGECWCLTIIVHVMLALDVISEVGAVDGEVDLKKDANGVINGGSTGNQLRVVLMEECMDLQKLILQT